MILSPSLGQDEILTLFSPGGALSCVGPVPGFAGTNTWPVANQAMYYPLLVDHALVARTLVWISGTAVSGNYDLGLYDATGKRLASSGSIAVPATNAIIVLDMADLQLEQQLVYVSLALTSATCQYYGYSLPADTQEMRIAGLLQEAAAVPLPATATFATLSGTVAVPLVGIRTRTWDLV